ncbi:MAG: phage portal protein [Clostridia bacterium]|nr:phage portal protein [Clostridia bacterium]
MSNKRSRDRPAMERVKAADVGGPVISRRGITVGGVSSSLDAFLRDVSDYIPLYEAPEVRMCVHQYADLVSNMTIRLMENTEHGDRRVNNELAAFLDRTPSKSMNRKTLVYWIVETLFTAGDGNAVLLPAYDGEYLADLVPLDPAQVIFEDIAGEDRYRVRYGQQVLRPDEVLHFRINPELSRPWIGRGFRLGLRQIVDAIAQAGRTKDSLMKSPMPSLIVKLDGLTEEFQSEGGREKLLDKYVRGQGSGKPWIIPAELMDVKEIKPLSIKDLAISENLKLDQTKIACLMGVPPFTVGAGEYRDDAYNFFVNQGVRGVAAVIEQEMTRKLIYNPAWHVQLNPRSLYNYKLEQLVTAGKELVDRAAMRRNEWRDWIGLSPDEDMDELYLLENYLPPDRLGDQKKLLQKGGGGDED